MFRLLAVTHKNISETEQLQPYHGIWAFCQMGTSSVTRHFFSYFLCADHCLCSIAVHDCRVFCFCSCVSEGPMRRVMSCVIALHDGQNGLIYTAVCFIEFHQTMEWMVLSLDHQQLLLDSPWFLSVGGGKHSFCPFKVFKQKASAINCEFPAPCKIYCSAVSKLAQVF